MTDQTVVKPVVALRRRENTRQKLLDAAALVFAEVGLDAASVETICERAGFTRGAFYSNFESKDELFLELAGRVSRERIEQVTRSVARIEQEGGFEAASIDAFAIIDEVLDLGVDDRLGVLLMSEIRIHSLRDPQLAAAYLRQDEELQRSIAQIVGDIGRAGGVRFRVSAEEAARLLLTVWEGTSVRGAMAGLDYAALCQRTSEELARLADLLIEPRGE